MKATMQENEPVNSWQGVFKNPVAPVGVASMGDCVRPGRYALLSRFRRVENFTDGVHLAALVSHDTGGGPFHIVLEGDSFGRVRELEVRPDALCLDGALLLPLKDVPRFDSSMPVSADLSMAAQAGRLAELEQWLLENAPPRSMVFALRHDPGTAHRPGFERVMAEQLQQGVDAFRAGDDDEAVRLLRGCGLGLTPSGDDFLAGWFIARHLRSRMSGEQDRARIAHLAAAAVEGRLPLSLPVVFLRLAGAGRVNARTRRLIQALQQAGRDAWVSAAAAVMQTGATSGADWLAGFVTAARLPR